MQDSRPARRATKVLFFAEIQVARGYLTNGNFRCVLIKNVFVLLEILYEVRFQT